MITTTDLLMGASCFLVGFFLALIIGGYFYV